MLIPLVLFVLSKLDTANLLRSIKQVPAGTIVMLLGLQIMSQLLLNYQWYKIARFTRMNISFRDMFYINCQGAVIDSITPGVKFGGEVTRAVALTRKANCSGEEAATVVALQKLFSMSAFIVINLFAVGYLVGKVPLLQARYLQITIYSIMILILAIFVGIFLASRQLKEHLQRKSKPRFSWGIKVRGFLVTMLEQVIFLRQNSKMCTWLLLLAPLIWLFYPVKMYLLTIHFLPHANQVIMYITAITFVSYLVAMVPIFPGGLGGFEGTMSGLLLTIGFTSSDAVVVAILFRFITFWLVMLLSLGFITVYKVRRRATATDNYEGNEYG